MPVGQERERERLEDIVPGKHLLEIQTANRNAQRDIARERRKIEANGGKRAGGEENDGILRKMERMNSV